LRICVIFNPVARGNKARHFRRDLERIGRACALKPTTCAGDGQRLAALAVDEGFDVVVAAGGDGTVNEVVNGIAQAPGGFGRSRLGVLPLGTVNVFAKELGIPGSLPGAWSVINAGRETRVDLPWVEHTTADGPARRYFAQLGGAGLDSRAIALVDWSTKKAVGPLAYVLAGLKALRAPPSAITVTGGGRSETGELVLVGNGRFYGGRFRLFPEADLRDGRLDVRVFPRARLSTILRCVVPMAFGRPVPASVSLGFQASTVTLSAPVPTPVEIDGDCAGHLPAVFSLVPGGLRVLAP